MGLLPRLWAAQHSLEGWTPNFLFRGGVGFVLPMQHAGLVKVSCALRGHETVCILQPMSVTLDIPDDVLCCLPVPAPEHSRYLRVEIACMLYGRGVLSLGRAAELAGMAKFDFGVEAGNRGIPRHYTTADLDADLAYAGGE
jgi:predicted HTH domain antitoxin